MAIVVRRPPLYLVLVGQVQEAIALLEERRREIEEYLKSHLVVQNPTKRQIATGQKLVPQTKTLRGLEAAEAIREIVADVLKNLTRIHAFLQTSSDQKFYDKVGVIGQYVDKILKEFGAEKRTTLKYKDVHQKIEKDWKRLQKELGNDSRIGPILEKIATLTGRAGRGGKRKLGEIYRGGVQVVKPVVRGGKRKLGEIYRGSVQLIKPATKRLYDRTHLLATQLYRQHLQDMKNSAKTEETILKKALIRLEKHPQQNATVIQTIKKRLQTTAHQS